jgi:pimeloyl-ACP methyl ester carboxylesterase
MSAPRTIAALAFLGVTGLMREAGASSVALEVPGFGPAVAIVPIASEARRPMVIALHGNYDRPEWQCEVWGQIAGAGAFVLCPRGVPRTDAPRGEDRWTWDGLQKTAAEVDAAISALSARYEGRVDASRAVLAGFSLGATLAARIGSRHPERFARLVLVEGGDAAWTSPVARGYAKGGGVRVLAACGQSACSQRFRALAWAFRSAELPFRVVGTPSAGHTYDGAVAESVAQNFSWFVEGDSRFGVPE